MNLAKRLPRISPLGLMSAAGAMLLSGCYYYEEGYGHGYGAYYQPNYGHHHTYHAKLKPKEKAYYGYGSHAGHPHGGPPGQVKKYYGGHKGHPHGGPPGQMKKHLY